jgi:galactonate dehydratase
VDPAEAYAAESTCHGVQLRCCEENSVKIVEIETFPVQPRWLFLKISTDEGLSGWGECLGDKAHVVAQAVHSFAHHIQGEDPGRIVHLWQSMFRGAFWRGGPTLMAAISGIEIALWDILGRRLGVPVYQLLGGAVRERVRVYTRPVGTTADELAQSAAEIASRGFTALKFCPFDRLQIVDHYRLVDEAAEKVAAVRRAVGNGIDILLDFHGRASPTMAMWMEEAMRTSHPMFIEEPVLPENVDALAAFTLKSRTPVATGERLFGKWAFREVLEKGAAAVLQPDPCICGGIFETRQIGTLAECHYAALAPHNPYGPINLAAALQVDACTPNFLLQEYIHLGEGYLKKPFVVQNGHIELPTSAGLGIEVDEEYVRSLPLSPLKDVGIWRHESDGSVADW